MKKLLTLLAALALVVSLAACGNGGDTTDPVDENTAPTLSGVADANLTLGADYDPMTGVTASDEEDGDLTSAITVQSNLDLDAVGTYTVVYSVTDSAGETVTATASVVVGDLEVVYPTGFYNYKFASADLRHTFMAAAEDYLMHNMYAGIPLFASGSFALYSDRLQLPVDEYVAVMGFGTSFATMSADDSTVLMDDGQPGNVGEYTYRTTVGSDPATYNQWIYDDADTSDLMSVYMDQLYVYQFNADKTGYEVVPSMAASDPVPVDSTTLNGKVVAKTWEVTLRDDLEWYFHPDTDATFLASNPDTTIDANDFIDTFKLAVEQDWFRAMSGGGDFKSNGIVNIQEFYDGAVGWDQVGLQVKDGDDLTIVFTFDDDQSEWNMKYFLSSFVQTPINTELYDFLGTGLGENETNPFGTSNTTIAYHGAYYVDYHETGKIVRMKENPNYHSADDFFFTGYTFSIITDSTIIYQEFNAGKLEGTGIPTANVEDHENDPRLKKVPGATTYRIMINGTGDVDTQRELFPDGSWIPEPILANQYFKQAMFFALDRQTLAEDLLKVRTTNMYYFSDAYLVEAESGIPYRSTEQGEGVGADLSPDTYGFNFDAARNYFLAALDQEIEAGNYAAGTEANPTIITIELNNYADSESWDLACGYIKTAFEDAFQDTDRHIQVEVEIYTKAFPDIYYDYMMIGEFDLSVGGISGSTLDAASFLDTYSSDNRSGFTLNWGIDTSVAEIEVRYETEDGLHREMWSFDAIAMVLVGELYVSEGAEAVVPAAKDIVQYPTSLTFTIDQFLNVNYTDITYTIEYYSLADDAYYDLEGFTGITPDGADVTVTGLDAFFYGYDETETVVYQGDYKVRIDFTYASDDTKTGSTVSAWFEMGRLVTATLPDEVTAPDVTLAIAVNDDLTTRAISSIDVYTGGAMATGVTVDFTDLTAVTLTGLAEATSYRLLVTFDDGETTIVSVTTVDPNAAE